MTGLSLLFPVALGFLALFSSWALTQGTFYLVSSFSFEWAQSWWYALAREAVAAGFASWSGVYAVDQAVDDLDFDPAFKLLVNLLVFTVLALALLTIFVDLALSAPRIIGAGLLTVLGCFYARKAVGL